MVWTNSALLKPGTQPVTGAQVVTALSQMIGGLTDRLTDEPELRETLGPPPGHKH
jgi:hypothetical protein